MGVGRIFPLEASEFFQWVAEGVFPGGYEQW